MGFGANIRKLRTMEHLGQAQLAEMLGVSKETVCRWEKSRYAPRERHIEKLQALFDCTRDELVGEENGLAVKLANKRIVTDEDPAIHEMEGAFPVIDIESQKRRITHSQQNACAPVDHIAFSLKSKVTKCPAFTLPAAYYLSIPPQSLGTVVLYWRSQTVKHR